MVSVFAMLSWLWQKTSLSGSFSSINSHGWSVPIWAFVVEIIARHVSSSVSVSSFFLMLITFVVYYYVMRWFIYFYLLR